MKNLQRILLLILLVIFGVGYASKVYANTDLELVGGYAVLVEQRTGKILYEKDVHQCIYLASTTKILTALVAVDYLEPDGLLLDRLGN